MAGKEEKISSEQGFEEAKSSEPVLASKERILIAGVWIELVDMAAEATPFRIEGNNLVIDKERFNKEREAVKEVLAEAIRKGDRAVFDKMTGGLSLAEDEEHIDLYIDLQKLFKEKSAKRLDSINVDLLTDGIAQRNIIREGLKPQVAKLPFSFRDRSGNLLDMEKDIDIVFIRGKGEAYKLIVGAKKGIDEIELPDDFSPDQFQPDFLKIEKDPVADSITIPLKPTKDGSESYVTTIEVRKGPVDLPAKVAREEVEEQTRKARKRKEEEYNPPPARTPRRSSESGGYGYVRVSG